MSTPDHESPTSPLPDDRGADGPQPQGAPPPAPPEYGQPESGQQDHGQPEYGQQGYPAQPMPGPPPWAQYSQPTGALGTMRPTGMIILLFFVTLGIWGFVYYFQTHEEMKRHTGEGLGGIIALLIAVIFGIVSPFLLSNEVGKLYERRGQAPPVTALTGLWFFPGIFILVGPFIWFVRTNNALNEYWRSQGVTRTSLV
ncbi:protein of unknown function [Blastococcus aggregatus]|uniref:DUF4234 domain-containing protein n=1 Tax=Blastococcus aggregatus TaxID=38502 RepID=A0A285V845_9ACTN|nr:DUF4234 domain-containing protein [Blastococcus aggregatus]SOC50240.1 protein of unknown function [Blastococcus aggregatus]